MWKSFDYIYLIVSMKWMEIFIVKKWEDLKNNKYVNLIYLI